ncbi:G2/mitotic-specific cyclin-B-like [Babylonia areolata]|uniref:G2/mitotic-specific cyclin-B-like n=1 Tax=Babylonia areolata TaxID=304850 RepID=UPI003FD339DA
MATAANVSMPTKHAAPAKRRMSRDLALPDVTNLADVHLGDKARRQSVAPRAANFISASGQENGDRADRGQQVHPERAAKIAAKAKIRATITPFEPMEIDNTGLVVRALEVHVPDTVVDIDDHDDFLLAPEYAQDIVSYMKAQETLVVLPSDFLEVSPDITSQMRGILIDWLIQVQAHEQLEEETLQLTVVLTDLYLARAPLPLHHLQLLGVTCLLLAAKYVERFPPLVSTLCGLTAGTYEESEVVEMERMVLGAVDHFLGLPLPLFFLSRLMLVHPRDLQSEPLAIPNTTPTPAPVQVERLANYLVDLSLPSIRFVTVAPSLLAASAFYVSRCVWLPDDPAPWSAALQHYSGYSVTQLQPSAVNLAKILLRAPLSKYQGSRQKHSAEVPYGAISLNPVLDSHPVLLHLAHTQGQPSDHLVTCSVTCVVFLAISVTCVVFLAISVTL